MTKTLSAVSDATNYDVHLAYVDDETTDKIAYKRWDNNGGSSAWDGTATTIASGADLAYPSLSFDTNDYDLVAFYINTNTNVLYYNKCNTASSPTCTTWETPTSWKTAGPYSYTSSNYNASCESFTEYSVGSTQVTVDWDDVTNGEGGGAASLQQNDFEWFVSADSVTLSNNWPSGTGDDLTENQTFTQIPTANLPLKPYDSADTSRSRVRAQMNFVAASGACGGALTAASQRFQLQYVELPNGTDTTNDCTVATQWTAVGAKGATDKAFRLFDEASIGDSTDQVNQISTSTAGSEGYYSEINYSAVNPYAVDPGEYSEWDWPLENYNATENATYCFRMVKHDGVSTATPFSSYNSDSYPKLFTEPGTAPLMRHGNLFSGDEKKGFFWAD